MSPEQKQRRRKILDADEENRYALVDFLSPVYLEDYPDDTVVQMYWGRTLSALCRWDQPDEAFDNASRNASASDQFCIWVHKAEAYFNSGGVLVALGRLEEAAECYEVALDISPDYEIARFRLEDVERVLELRRE